MDKKATQYIQRQETPQKEICSKLRKIILSNLPKIEETVMSEGLWYEGKFYLACFKDHVNLGLSVDGLNGEDLKNFEGKGKYLRHIKFYSMDDIDEEGLIRLLKLVYRKTKCICKINWKS